MIDDEDFDVPQPFRVLVTASRTWPQPVIIVTALDALLADHLRLVVIHGACPKGGDMVAHNWIWTRRREGNLVDEIARPADWERHGRRAGMLRNLAMVTGDKPDAGLAFIHNDSPGTKGCIRELRRFAVSTTIFRLDGDEIVPRIERR